jgi:hypothetical protein
MSGEKADESVGSHESPRFYARPPAEEPGRPAAGAAGRDSAGDHLVVRVLRAHPGDTVSQTRARLAAGDLILDSAEAVWLVDSDRRLVGAVPLPRLLAADGARSLAEIASRWAWTRNTSRRWPCTTA